MALLIHNHPERASDQWMWTPAKDNNVLAGLDNLVEDEVVKRLTNSTLESP